MDPEQAMDPREAAVRWVAQHLSREHVPGAELLAPGMVEAADRYRVPIDPILLDWIHEYAGKRWTLGAWERFCAGFRALIDRRKEQASHVAQAAPDD